MTSTAAKPALIWQDDPAIVLLNDVLGEATKAVGKGGYGGYLQVAEADRPNPDPGGYPIQGANVRVVVPSAEIAEQLRSRLGSEFSDITIENSVGPGTDAALYLWVPGPHGRVGTRTNNRCREILCRTAGNQRNLADKEKRRARLQADPTIAVHGRESTRTNYDCNCQLCRDAHAAAAGARKQRRRLANIVDTVTAMGGRVIAEPGDDPAETVIYAVLPTVDAASEVFRSVADGWANSQLQGFQVSFIVDTRLAVDLDLLPAIEPEAVAASANETVIVDPDAIGAGLDGQDIDVVTVG